jgi:hypothetical protein
MLLTAMTGVFVYPDGRSAGLEIRWTVSLAVFRYLKLPLFQSFFLVPYL